MTPKTLLIGILRLYKALISPWLPPACRFHPTCSQYAIEALEEHGAWRGAWLGARRLLRCHPWSRGGFDPVPPAPGRPDNALTTETPEAGPPNAAPAGGCNDQH